MKIFNISFRGLLEIVNESLKDRIDIATRSPKTKSYGYRLEIVDKSYN